MRTLILLLFLLLTEAWPGAAVAAEPYFAISGSASSTSLTGIASPTAPTLYSSSVGGTFGLMLNNWFLIGATSAYQWTSQYSDTSPPVGNWRGTRWNIFAPTVGFYYSHLSIQGDYEFLGSYKLSNQAQDGSNVSYGSPAGYGIGINFWFTNYFALGMNYRHTSYSVQNSSSGGSTDLGTKIQTTNLGLSATFALSGQSAGGH